MRIGWKWLGIAAAAMACGPSRTPPVQMMAVVLGPDGSYGPHQVTLDTLTDVVALKGSVLTMTGGARIIVDPNDPLLQTNNGNLTDQQVANIFLKNKGRPPRASYVEKAGVLWPADFHTWNMVSTYYNFEKAYEYWLTIGASADEMANAQVYYFPYFALLDQSPNPLEDNALFFSPEQAFMILPFKVLQTVPLPMNFGVIAHEFSHRVFNKRVYHGQSFPDPIARWGGSFTATPALNLLKSIDEGLADWNGYGATCLSLYGCNTRFFSASLGQGETDARDMAQNKCVTQSLRDSLNSMDIGTYTGLGLQYTLGTVFTSALFHASDPYGTRGVLQQAVLATYTDLNTNVASFQSLIDSNLNTPQNFTPAAVADAVLAHISDLGLRTTACTQFMDRLQLLRSSLPNCPAGAPAGNQCPVLPP